MDLRFSLPLGFSLVVQAGAAFTSSSALFNTSRRPKSSLISTASLLANSPPQPCPPSHSPSRHARSRLGRLLPHRNPNPTPGSTHPGISRARQLPEPFAAPDPRPYVASTLPSLASPTNADNLPADTRVEGQDDLALHQVLDEEDIAIAPAGEQRAGRWVS